MNIHLNDSNLIVNYIQSVIKNNYTNLIRMSNKYDYDTHNLLVRYLKIPNTINIDSAVEKLNNLEVITKYNEKIKLMKYFKYSCDLNNIYFIYKGMNENKELVRYMNDDNVKSCLRKFLYSIGYKLVQYNSFSFPYSISISKDGIITNFPKSETLRTINLNCNKYFYNIMFDDSGVTFSNENDDVDYVIRKSENNKTKLCVIECEPNKTYTIIAGGDSVSKYNISVGSCIDSINDTKIGNIVYNVKSYSVLSGNYIKYTTNEYANSLVVQLPIVENDNDLENVSDISKSEEINILNVLIINDDIDEYDKIIKNKYYRYIDYEYDEIIRNVYYEKIENKYIQSTIGNYIKSSNSNKYYLVNSSTKYYKYNGNTKYYDESNNGTYIRVSKVDKYVEDNQYGNYIKSQESDNYYIIKDKNNMYYSIDENGNFYYDNIYGTYAVSMYNKYNIPIEEYLKDNFVIHSKFIDYITCNVISEYSKQDDIYTYQKYISEIRNYQYSTGVYDNRLKEIIKNIQIENNISYVSGFIDSETDYIIRNLAME